MSPLSLESAARLLDTTPLLRRERHALSGYLAAIGKRTRRGRPVDRSLAKWERQFHAARSGWERFQASTLALDYPEELPVSQRREELVRMIAEHPVVIVSGDTGSGKTTQLPKMLYEAGAGNEGRIGVTQPRRIAATEMARRVAEECRVSLGEGVGASIRFEDRTRDTTRVQFMTDGLLLSKLPSDPDWLEYGAILIDEAHERSLNIDFLLGCLKNLLERRADLKVVVSSATLDAERFSEFFGGAPIVTVEGRMYPIEDVFLPPDPGSDLELPDLVSEALEEIDRAHGPRDTLVFLPGEREIRDTARKLEGRYRGAADILPLFARLGAGDQRRVFATGSRRRVVLATNVAETSLTIPGIRVVVDTGLARLRRFHPQSRIQRLVTEQVSQASSRQRRGRCGRTGPGVCARLYSEEALARAPAHTDPEIRRDSLAEVILRMAALGLPGLREFPLLDPPKGAQINEGYRTLEDIGAMTPDHRLTNRGRRLASFSLDPRLSRMLEEGHGEKVLPATLICVAYLSMQDPRERPAEKAEAADKAHKEWSHPSSDFLGVLAMWNAVAGAGASRGKRRRFCQQRFLHAKRVEEWIRLVDDLRDTCARHDWSVPESIGEVEVMDPDGLHRSLLAGVPRSIGEREDNRAFRAPNGKTFRVFPGSGLADKPPRWVVAFSLVETSALYARECAAIRPEWVEEVAPQLCKTRYERPAWNRGRGFVEAEERVSLGQLTLRAGHRVHYGRVAPEEARAIFLRDALAPGELEADTPSFRAFRTLLADLDVWERKLRRPGWFLGSDAILGHLERVAPPDLHNRKAFLRWSETADWVPSIGGLAEDAELSAADFPDELRVDGVRVEVRYAMCPGDPDRDGVTYRVPEEDLPRVTDALLEWTVPGHRGEQVAGLFRSLDKPLRLACAPLRETAAEALDWVRDQEFAYTHSLTVALAAFLAARLDRIVGAGDFDFARLPAHLQPYLEVVDAEGGVVYEGADFPGRREVPGPSGPVSGTDPSLERNGVRDWPDLPMDQPAPIGGGREGVPALVDQGDVCGVRVFRNREEADEAHAAGVARLFALRHPDPIRYLQKRLPLPTHVQMHLAAMPGDDTLDDLLEGIVVEALAPEGHPPRTRDAFEAAAERARGVLFEAAERRAAQLIEVFEARERALEALEREVPPDTRADLELQWQTLWAPGWCRDPETLRRMPRYLKGVETRVERCVREPVKDARKLSELDPSLTRFSEALPALSPRGVRLALRKIQELRLAVFAPELRPHEKTGPARFERWLSEWDP